MTNPKRKVSRRQTTFKSSSWYQAAALSIAIPEDRRGQT
jgi:hypothetical protein